ncbi:MAG: saccharopine dehydrogenase NADP-binding domain-containing protein [Acetobacteraceae bacterium]|nr:saccharopine dehydrogenase NADP-binding domain-containing protein [Acetobacteraceae bacterium]
MRLAVLGAGLMGSVLAGELVRDPEVEEVTLFDRDEARLEAARERAGPFQAKIRPVVGDASDGGALARVLEGHQAAGAALLNRHSLGAMRAAIRAGVHMVDLAASDPQAKLALDAEARRAGVCLVPGLGVAPGISNVLVGRAASVLDRMDEAVIRVGGLPQRPLPPLGYRVVFALDSVLESCTRPAPVIREGRTVEVPALSEPEAVEFPPPVGRCECFITDGLGTLPYSLPPGKVWRLEEKTVRYPGYCQAMTMLRELGLLDERPVRVDGAEVAPRRLVEEVLGPLLSRGGEEDLLVMRVEARGTREGRPARLAYELLDVYDRERGISAMARTTCFPCAIAMLRLGRGGFEERGSVPPETLIGARPERFEWLMAELGRRGVEVRVEEE